MSERRAWPERERWPWWKRWIVTAFRFSLGSLLNRRGDALSWSASALTLFLLVEAWRLMPQPWENNLRIVPVIGWPDLFLCLLILWGRWIDSAATTVAERNPDKIVDQVLPQLLDRLGVGDTGGTSSTITYAMGQRRVREDEQDGL